MTNARIAQTLAVILTGLAVRSAVAQDPARTPIGTVERLDPRLDAILEPDAQVERLVEGYDWAEGPIWFPEEGGYLLFSDVPQNVVYRWDEAGGVREFLRPSGYTGKAPRGGEPGSNGLLRDPEGRLVLMQHGDRRVARLGESGFETIVGEYDGKRFNSPNDGTYDRAGNLYFTDPPYGLVGGPDDPAKELAFQGVYRLSAAGELTLLTDELSRPNGIALSPDESTLYVANSDPERAIWMAYPLKADGTIGPGRVFDDLTDRVGDDLPGLPDGLKVDRAGNLFATGPGGVLIYAPDGTHLGTLKTGVATANVAWGEDGQTLFVAADSGIGRIPVKTGGIVPGSK